MVGGVRRCSDHDHLLRCGQTVAPRYRLLKAFQGNIEVMFISEKDESETIKAKRKPVISESSEEEEEDKEEEVQDSGNHRLR